MNTPQTAILPEAGQYAAFIIFNVDMTRRACQHVIQQARRFPALLEALACQHPAAGLRGTVAFGAAFWERISPDSKPAQLCAFKALDGPVHHAPATGGDVFVHLHSARTDLNFLLLQRFYQALAKDVSVLDEVHGFRYLDSRDLTGFIDGTENPRGEDRAPVALIGAEDPRFAGGSYVLTQRYVHHLEQWCGLPVHDQERVIGRTREDSRELEGADKPATAHISRVVIEAQGEELEIVRHSMPYGRVAGDSGLFFLAYSHELTIFDRMLARMYGLTDDGLADHLLDYTRPQSGAYFFAPSLALLQALPEHDC